MENLMLELADIIVRLPDVKSFRFRFDNGIEFKPGQYLLLTLNIDGKDVVKPFSISNAPTEKGYVEFTKKLTGSSFSNRLNTLKAGASLPVRLPMGRFTFEGEFEKVVFLSGGIGITPVRSMIKYATDMRLSSSIVLLYSSHTAGYHIFREDLENMQKINKNLTVIYVLTGCSGKIGGYREGRISENMIKEEVPDYAERRFFVCGPPGMVDAMRSILRDKLSLPKENIIIEGFLGY